MSGSSGKLLVELDPTEARANIEQVWRGHVESALETTRLETALRLLDGEEEARFEFTGEADPLLVEIHRNKLKADLLEYQRRLEFLQARKEAADAEKR